MRSFDIKSFKFILSIKAIERQQKNNLSEVLDVYTQWIHPCQGVIK